MQWQGRRALAANDDAQSCDKHRITVRSDEIGAYEKSHVEDNIQSVAKTARFKQALKFVSNFEKTDQDRNGARFLSVGIRVSVMVVGCAQQFNDLKGHELTA